MAKRNKIMLDDDILLFQILPRVPARSLGRFKGICKQWRSFLTTPVFTKMHLHHVNNQNHYKQLIVPFTGPCNYFRTIDCETHEVGLSANHSLPFKANDNEISVIASLDGLVCVGIHPLPPRICRYSDIVLWNPLTGHYKTLSKDIPHDNCSTIPARGYGLYYSCCDDDYKLLCVTLCYDAYIYSLKSDSWRKVESTCCGPFDNMNSSCLLNENLYLLAQGINEMVAWSYSIIRFDTKTEKFTKIAAPSLEYVAVHCFSLTVVSGCIHLWVGSGRVNLLELWKLEGDGEWTKMISCCHTLFKDLQNQPLHMMNNGNLLVGPIDKVYAYEVDLEMKTAKTVYTPTPTDGPMYFLWRGKFVETILSVNK